MLPVENHIFWEKTAVVVGIYLIYDGYVDLKKNRKDKRALLRLIIGIGTIIVDGFIFLPSFGINLLGG